MYQKWINTVCPACKSSGAENLFELGDHAHVECVACNYNWSILLSNLYAESRTKAGLELEAIYGEQIID